MSYCYLFVPGHRFDRFEKAHSTSTNFMVIDLEDAVAPQDKTLSRENVLEWLTMSKNHAIKTIVRINGIETEFFKQDAQALSHFEMAAIMVPKVESTQVLEALDNCIENKHIPFIPIIESAQGLLNLQAIANGPRVDRLAFGSVDFQLDTGIPSEGQALLFARSSIVIASAAAKLQSPIDGVTLEIGDTQALKKDIEYAKSLGFGAKLCIHPCQVEETLSGFSPNEKEVAWAREVCLASDQAQGSAVRLNGKLIDLPVVLRAKRILQSFHADQGTDR